jgi:hypothetical protein
VHRTDKTSTLLIYKYYNYIVQSMMSLMCSFLYTTVSSRIAGFIMVNEGSVNTL